MYPRNVPLTERVGNAQSTIPFTTNAQTDKPSSGSERGTLGLLVSLSPLYSEIESEVWLLCSQSSDQCGLLASRVYGYPLANSCNHTIIPIALETHPFRPPLISFFLMRGCLKFIQHRRPPERYHEPSFNLVVLVVVGGGYAG